MINRDVLKQIGFVLGDDWDHEVWIYEGNFWVHFGGKLANIPGKQISGESSMKQFFEMFIQNIKEEAMDSVSINDYR